jgi:hypothetical protein
VLQAFVSLVLVGASLLLFGHSAQQRDHEHSDRLALLPIEDDASQTPARTRPESGRDEAGTHTARSQ